MQMIVIELLQIITQGIEWLIRYLWHLETLVLKSKVVTLCFYQIREFDLATPPLFKRVDLGILLYPKNFSSVRIS